MSNDAISWAWRARVGAAKLVLVALADHGTDHSGEDWFCFPSVARLVFLTELGRSTVERHLRWLDAEGWITRRRRIRPDGRLGIFDYTLHRDEHVRANLKAERLGLPPPLKMSGGEGGPPALILSDASAQNDVGPALKMSAQEPLDKPSIEPTPCAREPGDAGFEEGFAAYPVSGQRRTDIPEARAAWALAAGEIGAEALIDRVRRYAAEDHDLKTGTRGAQGFQRWLSAEKWRTWGPESAAPVAATEEAPRTAFVGPPALREAVVAYADDAFARSYLDRCIWLSEGALIAANDFAFDRLRARVGHILNSHGVELIAPRNHRRGGE